MLGSDGLATKAAAAKRRAEAAAIWPIRSAASTGVWRAVSSGGADGGGGDDSGDDGAANAASYRSRLRRALATRTIRPQNDSRQDAKQEFCQKVVKKAKRLSALEKLFSTVARS